MPSVKDKPQLGRQTHLPLSRAFKISMNSLKIRFGRSVITAGGVFLGIAFLSTVLTQSLMKWPLPEKIDAGYVYIDGEVVASGEQDVWRRVPLAEALAAGIPQEVIDKVDPGEESVNLREIVQGRLDALHADETVKKMKSYHAALLKVNKKYYSDEYKDKDITLKDAEKAGIPKSVAKRLAGEGKAFKGSALMDARDQYPNRIKIWETKATRVALFKEADVDSAEFKKLASSHAITLADVLKDAQTMPNQAVQKNVKAGQENAAAKADWKEIMIVNENGRKDMLNLTPGHVDAATIKMGSGDYIFVPDKNSRYRTYWLVVMSLLVCAVGITNSMLMAVTERFKEIGTMKCLGALDRFVVTLLVMESGMMGIVASVMGWLVGFVLMVVMAGYSKGWEVVGNMDGLGIVITLLASIGVGFALTMAATIAPALRAANMPAAMALRTEI